MEETKPKKKRTALWVILIILALLITYCSILAVNGYKLLEPAKIIKGDLNRIRAAGLETDTDTMRTFTADLGAFAEDAESFLLRPSVKMLKIIPRFARLENMGLSGIALVKKMIPELLEPLPDILDQYPITDIKTKGGYDTRPLIPYLDFAYERLPLFKEILEFALTVDDPLIDRFVPMEKVRGMCEEALGEYDYICDFVLFAKKFLGNGEDRAYFLGVSNTAEMRAGGGFLGSMAPVRIKDGILKIGDFDTWHPYLTETVVKASQVTKKERTIFTYLVGYPRDASYIPDFTRMGKIWCDSYTAKTGVKADGAIGLTPTILQKLLKTVDYDIKLSDGSIINGDNATKVLQYDLYFKYFPPGVSYNDGDAKSNPLFAEAAEKSMDAITGNLSAKKFLEYIKVFRESSEDRTLMIWMKDEEEEELVKKLGCSGALNYDETAPEVGVFFSNRDANKMGMFFDQSIEVSEPVKNEDGSCTYDVTAVFESKMSDKEKKKVSTYVYGTMGGKLRGDVHLFAPAGGTIEILECPKGVKFIKDEYMDLEMEYVLGWYMQRNVPYEVKFRVTTAPGVDAPLTVECTPTIYQYTHPEE